MKLSLPQYVICWMLVVITPSLLLAADVDPGGAMLYGRGKEAVLVNGQPSPRLVCCFPG